MLGHRKRFFVTDLIERRVYEVDAELLAVSENAYWYADEETELTDAGARTDGGCVRAGDSSADCDSHRRYLEAGR